MLPHEAWRWPGVGWCLASLRLLGPGRQREEPSGHFLRVFHPPEENRAMKPLSMGTRLPSPRAHAATSLGGMLWLSVRWGALEWRRWAAPEERGAAGSSSRRWSESHPPHVRGPRLPFPRLSAPTTLTRTTKAPSGRRGPRLPARAGRAEGEGWGAGGARPPFCWGLGRGTAWDRLRPPEVAPRRRAVKTPASRPRPPRLNRRPAQRPSERSGG